MYDWRKMTDAQQTEILSLRKLHSVPWHSPPHSEEEGLWYYHLTGACYEHKPIIGVTPERMAQFEQELLKLFGERLHAWCVLPNHWHALLRISELKTIIEKVGELNGRTSFQWNGEDGARGRKCWHRCSDRRIRSDNHRFATMNYIHHNSVKHGYTKQWEDWPFSSAAHFLEKEGREQAIEIWKKYPIDKMGNGWDD